MVRQGIGVLHAMWLLPPALAGLTVAQPVAGSAATLDVSTLTQLMIEDQGQDVFLLGLEFGFAPQAISFTSNVDAGAQSYSYTTVAGSKYLGEALSISATATFDPSTDIVTVDSSTTLGLLSYSTVATNTLTVAPDLVRDMEKRDIPEKMVDGMKVNDEEWRTLENRDNGRTIDLVYLTFNGKRVPIPPTPSIDMYRPLPGTWTFNQTSTALLFRVISSGSSSSTGGPGTFTSNLVAIPEPTTMTLLGLGVAGLIGKSRKWRGRSRPET
jgi:hypothetical protein